MGRKAFTLIELLMTVAIIGLLLTVLLPALQQAREQSRGAACSVNLRQLAIAITRYSTETNLFPHAFMNDPDHCTTTPPGGPMDGLRAWFWFHFLDEYTELVSRKSSALRCPSRRIKDPGGVENPLWGNYGVNMSVCRKFPDRFGREEFSGAALPSSGVRRPSETLLVMDAGYPTIFWWQATSTPPLSGFPPSPPVNREDSSYIPGLSINGKRLEQQTIYTNQSEDALNGRHSHKTVNIGFVDGHVSRKSAEYTLVNKNGDGSYANRFFLWTPDQRSP